MDREGFRNRMKQYKEARGLNPLLKYWEWRNSLPDNLKYTNDAEYDMQGAYEAGMLPEWNEQDQSYHLGSRDPRTGRILKKFGHPTYYKALEEDAKMGYKTYVIGSNTYTWHDKDGVFVPWLNQLIEEAIPKYEEGTNFVTYDPDELQRNIQRVLHTTPEGEVNPFYNSLDDTYGSVELPEITVTAPYTRKASLAQQARQGREAYHKAGQKAAPVLAAIPLGAGILGAGSIFGFGPALDILDVASDPINPLSYIDKFDLLKIKKVDPLLEFNNAPLPRSKKINRNRIAAKRHLGTYNQSTDEISGNTVGELLTDEGTELFVFNSLRSSDEVFKMPNAYGRKSVEDLFKKSLEYLKFNKVPNFSKVKLEGHVDNGRGTLYPIFSQKRLHTLGEDIYSISGNQRWNTEIIPSLDKAMSKYEYKNVDGKYIKGNKIIGDIHPGNIGYTTDGNIKLIDVHIDNFADGGEVGDNNDYRQQIINRADYVASNYDDARDFDLNPLVYIFRKFAKDNFDRGGISNCTLSATGWIDPNNQYMSAKNIFNNPSSGYTEIDAGYALPGDLLIAKNPEKNSYHTMLIEGFNGNEPILRYSRGGHDTKENLVTGRPLAEYHELDNKQGGNHTEDHYFRYNIPNEYWLPELIVTPNKR